jgi:hypothetical protein
VIGVIDGLPDGNSGSFSIQPFALSLPFSALPTANSQRTRRVSAVQDKITCCGKNANTTTHVFSIAMRFFVQMQQLLMGDICKLPAV